jgi:hypothetical protein
VLVAAGLLILAAGLPTGAEAGPPGGGAPPIGRAPQPIDPSSLSVTEQPLYSFCAKTACTDGATPLAGLIMDSVGNLYGTTQIGGSSSEVAGVVFELTPNQAKTVWTETVLYVFLLSPFHLGERS